MDIRQIALGILIASAGCGVARADVKLPGIFTDHMVLQRDAAVPVWGWADPGEQISITAGAASANATADASGKWLAKLPAMKASFDPITLDVKGAKQTVTIKDVLVGDVWLCSGQSNMEVALSAAHNWKEVMAKAADPALRLFIVARTPAIEPLETAGRTWTTCDSTTAAPFSAVGYFFGKDIEADQHVPVGLIGSYWGGTEADTWTSLEGLKSDASLAHFVHTYNVVHGKYAELKAAHDTWDAEAGAPLRAQMKTYVVDREAALKDGKPEPAKPTPSRPEPQNPLSSGYPTELYNGMIAPLQPFAIKGVIWYQGESNAGAAMEYRKLFPAMIADWRHHWNQGDFPFIFVQLANYEASGRPHPDPGPSPWAALREAQCMTLAKSPNTAMAVIVDIGEGKNIHPKDKIDVGHRLALAARHLVYGESDVVPSGPMFKSLSVEGNKASLTFTDVGGGLKIGAAPSTQPGVAPEQPAGDLNGFAIAGADQHFVWASARVVDKDHVEVWSEKVPQPVAVRYGWADNPQGLNLYNAEGLPASPFRTDDWPAEKR